jgi:hypothetical protein
MTNRIVLSEIEARLHKLEKRVKKDEKSGLVDGKEKVKREPSEYNLFISEEMKKMHKSKLSQQEKFAECVRKWHEHNTQGKKKTVKKEEHKEKRREAMKRGKKEEEESEDEYM